MLLPRIHIAPFFSILTLQNSFGMVEPLSPSVLPTCKQDTQHYIWTSKHYSIWTCPHSLRNYCFYGLVHHLVFWTEQKLLKNQIFPKRCALFKILNNKQHSINESVACNHKNSSELTQSSVAVYIWGWGNHAEEKQVPNFRHKIKYHIERNTFFSTFTLKNCTQIFHCITHIAFILDPYQTHYTQN
jgi:hypothetical protein